MSDFLYRLAERALGQSPVVKPLVASRFAPGREILGRDAHLIGEGPLEPFFHAGRQPLSASPPHEVGTRSRTGEEESEGCDVHPAESRSWLPQVGPEEITGIPNRAEFARGPLSLAPTGDVRRSPVQAVSPAQLSPQAMMIQPPPAKPEVQMRPALSTSVPGENLSASGPDMRHIPQPGFRGSSTGVPIGPGAITPIQVEMTTSGRPVGDEPSSKDFVRPSRDSIRPKSLTATENEMGAARAPLRVNTVKAAANSGVPNAGPPQSPARHPVEAQAATAGRGALRPEAIVAREERNSQPSPARESGTLHVQAAPVIKVTIGRIEVRAVSPPAAPTAQPTIPLPRLSLDEYLQSLRSRRS
jgi:hypothetical protein